MKTDKIKSIIIHFILGSFILMGAFPSLIHSLPEKDLSHLLEQLKTYQQGENDSLILELNAFIRSHRTSEQGKIDCEQQLISFLKKEATNAGKREACRHLRIIGTDSSVPVLEDMLLDEKTTDMARYALEKIPGAAADKALLRNLDKSNGTIKAGLVSSLGHRKVPEAVPYLEKILNINNDSYLSLNAAAALGHIKNQQAAEVLLKVFPKTDGELRIQITGSLLKCAEQSLSKGNPEKAHEIFDQVLDTDLPSSLHNRAFRGKMKASDSRGAQLILKTLRGPKNNIYPSCIEMIPEYFNASNISQIISILPLLPDSAKIPLISVLSFYPEKQVRQAVLNSTQSLNQEVRLASLKTLGQIGSASTVRFLAQYAATSKGKEQLIARSSLWGLKGTDVDETLISNLKNEKNPENQIEYLKAVEERRIHSGKNILFSKLSSDNQKIRFQAVKSLKTITSPKDLPKLIEYLLNTKDHPLRDEMINTTAYAALKIQNPLDRGNQVTHALSEAKDPLSRSTLYRLLGRIGDDSTLPFLRRGLSEPHEVVQDSVVRALASWPTPTAAEDVLYLAQTSDKPEHQILCLRSYIKMIEMEPFRRPEAAVRSLETALDLAQREEEKIMILGVLPQFACEQALELAQRLSKVKDIEKEARNALSLIQENLKIKNQI